MLSININLCRDALKSTLNAPLYKEGILALKRPAPISIPLYAVNSVHGELAAPKCSDIKNSVF